MEKDLKENLLQKHVELQVYKENGKVDQEQTQDMQKNKSEIHNLDKKQNQSILKRRNSSNISSHKKLFEESSFCIVDKPHSLQLQNDPDKNSIMYPPDIEDEEKSFFQKVCNHLQDYIFPYIFLLIVIILLLTYLLKCPLGLKKQMNSQNGFISQDFSRVLVTPRDDFRTQLDKYKIYYYDETGFQWSMCEEETYWNEEGKADISANAEQILLEATFQLHSMCLEAVDKVVNDDVLLKLFYVNEELWPAIRQSWKDKQIDFIGRFDLSWDGVNPPKMLEYNADTPSMLVESGVVQDEWFNQRYPGYLQENMHQANYIQEALNKTLDLIVDSNCNSSQIVGLVQVSQDQENTALINYLNDVVDNIAHTNLIDINELKIQYDKIDGRPFWTDVNGKIDMGCIINNYPKEWLITEIEQDILVKYDFKQLKSLEPWWKLIIGNKAILPLLWHMYPNHPNLLQAYYDSPIEEINSNNNLTQNQKQYLIDMLVDHHDWVSKPLFGREGVGILDTLNSKFSNFQQFVDASEKNFGQDSSNKKLGKSIYQELYKLPAAQGRIIQVGSWVIGGIPAGLAFREGKEYEHFSESNPFLLHTVRRRNANNFNFKMTQNQQKLRNSLYGQNFNKYIYQKNIENDINFIVSDNFPQFSQTEEEKINFLKKSPKNYTQWNSYILQASQQNNVSQNYEFNDQELMQLRMIKLNQKPAQISQNVQNYLLVNPLFAQQVRKSEFGKILRFDIEQQNLGNPQWFSVDQRGQIRIHSLPRRSSHGRAG